MSKRTSPIKRLELLNKEADVYEEINSLVSENEKLTQLLYSKNMEIKSMIDENQHLQDLRETESKRFKATIQDLELRETEY